MTEKKNFTTLTSAPTVEKAGHHCHHQQQQQQQQQQQPPQRLERHHPAAQLCHPAGEDRLEGRPEAADKNCVSLLQKFAPGSTKLFTAVSYDFS